MHKQYSFVLAFVKQRSSFITLMVLIYQKYSKILFFVHYIYFMVPYDNEGQHLKIQLFIAG